MQKKLNDMQRILIFILILLTVASCKSIRKTTVIDRQQTDSTTYSSVTTVNIDTVLIPKDSATINAVISIGDNGNVIIEEIQQDQGNGISIDYSVQKTPEGKTKIKVKATVTEQQVITQSTNTEVVAAEKVTNIQQVTEEKIVKRGISPWHLAWVIPVLLIIIVIYLKRKTILKYLPF